MTLLDIRYGPALPLRDGRDKVSVIKPNDQTRVQLGVTYPEEAQRRAQIQQYWSGDAASPRQTPPVTIDEPLPQRTHTILSYRVPSQIRASLNSGTSNATTRDSGENTTKVGLNIEI